MILKRRNASPDFSTPCSVLNISVLSAAAENWMLKDSNKHKAIHVKCNVDDVSRVQTLLEAAKDKK